MTTCELSPTLAEVSIDRVIDRREVTSVFQPLVNLCDQEVVGYECLSRGPAGTTLESPMSLFAAAADIGRIGELDWVCRAKGLESALGAGAPPSISWFVNVEPAALSSRCPRDLLEVVEEAERRLHVVVELTERQVHLDPAALLTAAAFARDHGWGVALDDVGADPRSLALLPFIQPDVVKLDLSLVQGRNPVETAAISNAVRAYSESTGAKVLCEGIEDEAMLATALALGATYGQGWHFGRPGALPRRVPAPMHGLTFEQRVVEDRRTPFTVVSDVRRPQRATKELLLANSLHLERQAMSGGETMVLLSTFQEGRHLTPGTLRRYEELTAQTTFAAVLGTSMPAIDMDGLRIVDLADGDALAHEWDVIVVGPHFAGALLAKDCGDDGPDRLRRFDYVITYDRGLVLQAARSILRWITHPHPGMAHASSE